MADFDAEGYLQNYREWNEELATQLAENMAIQLNPAHWEIIFAIRDFYQQYEHSPATRPLLKYLNMRLGAEKSGSIYVMTLFPGTPAKTIAKIAGLPKPPNCI